MHVIILGCYLPGKHSINFRMVRAGIRNRGTDGKIVSRSSPVSDHLVRLKRAHDSEISYNYSNSLTQKTSDYTHFSPRVKTRKRGHGLSVRY